MYGHYPELTVASIWLSWRVNVQGADGKGPGGIVGNVVVQTTSTAASGKRGTG